MNDMQDMQFDSDFNVEEEYKPEPLAPAGTYRGHVTNVSFDASQQAIVWSICLSDNESFMSDGETPVDGSYHFARNWLPRVDDDTTMTKSGRGTKRAAKISMMKKFAEDMDVKMNTKEEIINALSEGLWIGIPVLAKLSINTWEGQTRNQIDKLIRDKTRDTVAVDNTDDIPF